MKIGLIQNNILWENKQFNLNASKNYFKEARDNNIDLLLFPELSFTGFSMNVQKLADTNSETITYISSLCRTYKINAGIGYIDGYHSTSRGRNKYAIISDSGDILCGYTKIHPFSYSKEDNFYEGGNTLAYCTINNITICPLICYDLRFPELFQIASKKSHLITVAANWPESRKDHWITLLKSRAIENQCYVAGVNRVGLGNKLVYSGNSMIINPLGEIIASTKDGEEGIITGVIDPETVIQARSSFPVKKDRKEELYYKLLKNNK